MASYTKLNLSELRTLVRYKLADPTGRWWPDSQLDAYINDWQDTLNTEFECTWAIATATLTSQFTASTAISTNIQRIHSIRRTSDSRELPKLSVYRLNEIDRSFRWIAGNTPGCWYEEEGKIGIFPSPLTTAVVTVEYVSTPEMSTSTSSMVIPAYMKYSVVPYVCSRAYGALGPNFDHNKVLRYKARFKWWVDRFRSVRSRWFASRPMSLKVDTGLANQLRNTLERNTGGEVITMPGILSRGPIVEVPTGTINGVNDTFTLTEAPDEILLIVNNAALVAGTHYTLSGLTITMNADYIPETGWEMTAYYWV